MSKVKLSPASEALAYRVWAYAKPLGWDCTLADLSAALGASVASLRSICGKKGWAGRLRKASADHPTDRRGKLVALDSFLEGEGYREAIQRYTR